MGWQTASVIQLFAGNTIINPNGLFVYNGAPALGNLPLFYVASAGTFTDPVGNSLAGGVVIGQQSTAHWHWDYTTGNLDVVDTGGNTILTIRAADGIKSYASSNVFVQITAGQIQFQAAAGQNSPGLVNATTAGEIGLSSGLVTGLDSAANIVVDSSAASGTGASQISLQATNVSLNTFATSTVPSANAFPGHQSAAPAAYSQSYEQASTNRINEIMDVLTQCGIWHT